MRVFYFVKDEQRTTAFVLEPQDIETLTAGHGIELNCDDVLLHSPDKDITELLAFSAAKTLGASVEEIRRDGTKTKTSSGGKSI